MKRRACIASTNLRTAGFGFSLFNLSVVLVVALCCVSGCDQVTWTSYSSTSSSVESDVEWTDIPGTIVSTDSIDSATANDEVEIGKVRWGRDFELAKKQSADTGKPILVLFQEVPG